MSSLYARCTVAGALILAAGCSPGSPPPIFVDITSESGIEFVHDSGAAGRFYFSEIVGAGVALLDYDNDGDLDIYLVQGGPLDPSAGSAAPGDRLLRNDVSPTGDRRFVDATESTGLGATGYGMGVAVADVDGNGTTDLYVTNHGPNQLWLNRGDGTFTDGTTETLAEPRWTTSATFLDYDRDGDQDLFATNYVEYRIEQNKPCLDPAGTLDYCGPSAFAPETDRLWRNNGAAGFTDVTGIAGMIDRAGSGLGVISADFNNDSWPDLYVANDLMPNHLWLNQGDGTFVEDALLAGCAVNENGAPEASMGIAVSDFDRDGDEDLFMTHLDTETNTAFANDGSGLFWDVSNEWGLSVPSVGLTGFGTVPIDFDNDGWMDLMAANGAVRTIASQRRAGEQVPLREPNLLLRNVRGTFEVATERVPALAELHVSRGAAAGDIDNDGDADLVIANNSGPAQLLRNDIGQDAAWLGVGLLAAGQRGGAIEGRVEVRGAENASLLFARTGGSYCSASDPRVLVGGTAATATLAVSGAESRLLLPRLRTRAYYRIPMGRP